MDPYFVCECASDVLASSHTRTEKRDMEEGGFVEEGGIYKFDQPEQVKDELLDDDWIAYCGGCGKGIIVEWLPDKKLKVIMDGLNQT